MSRNTTVRQKGCGLDAQGIDCHHFCQKSDPRRVILCKCRCKGQRHGQAYIKEHGAKATLSYYEKLAKRWEQWDRDSEKRLRVLIGGLRAASSRR